MCARWPSAPKCSRSVTRLWGALFLLLLTESVLQNHAWRIVVRVCGSPLRAFSVWSICLCSFPAFNSVALTAQAILSTYRRSISMIGENIAHMLGQVRCLFDLDGRFEQCPPNGCLPCWSLDVCSRLPPLDAT